MIEQLKSLNLNAEMIEEVIEREKVLASKCGDKKDFTIEEAMEYTNFNELYKEGEDRSDFNVVYLTREIKAIDNNKRTFDEYFKLSSFIIWSYLGFDPTNDSFLRVYRTHYERLDILLMQINIERFFSENVWL